MLSVKMRGNLSQRSLPTGNGPGRMVRSRTSSAALICFVTSLFLCVFLSTLDEDVRENGQGRRGRKRTKRGGRNESHKKVQLNYLHSQTRLSLHSDSIANVKESLILGLSL